MTAMETHLVYVPIVIGVLVVTVIVLIVVALRGSDEAQRLRESVARLSRAVAQLREEDSARRIVAQQVVRRIEELDQQLEQLQRQSQSTVHRLRLDQDGNLLEEN